RRAPRVESTGEGRLPLRSACRWPFGGGRGARPGLQCALCRTWRRPLRPSLRVSLGMTPFASLMRRADTNLRGEGDPIKAEWWRGYMRGLRRGHHGERFGSKAEHATWLDAARSDDPMRAALGKGYAAGLT